MTLVVSKCFALSNWYRWVFEHVADKTIDCSDKERELQHFLQILQRPLTTMSWSLKAGSEVIIIDPTWHDKKPKLTFLCRFPLNHCTSNNSSCVGSHSLTLHNVYIVQFFSPRPNEVRHILKFPCCHTIQHIFFPARSIEGKMEKNWFPWLSNSKFVIFPQIFPCSNYRILAFYAPIPVKIHGNSIISL